MVRKHRKMALYEVMGRARLKSGYDKTLEKLHPEELAQDEPSAESSHTPMPQGLAKWPRRPRFVQFNAGRIEISMPYQLAIAVLLGIVLLVLVFFRLGQWTRNEGSLTASDVREAAGIGEVGSGTAVSSPVESSRPAVDASGPVDAIEGPSKADNVIVLVQYRAERDLLPVQEHFAQYGIETEILLENGQYFLVTKDRYHNTQNPGSAGYIAKQEIIEVGAKYRGKAPEGFESFAPHFFADAYGRKVR